MDVTTYVCTIEEYEMWKKGLLLMAEYRADIDEKHCLDTYDNILIELKKYNPGIDLDDRTNRESLFEELGVFTYGEFFKDRIGTFETEKILKNGSKVISFGYAEY